MPIPLHVSFDHGDGERRVCGVALLDVAGVARSEVVVCPMFVSGPGVVRHVNDPVEQFYRAVPDRVLEEFFAVGAEAFFVAPEDLEREEPALYRLLREFFRQDPAQDKRNGGREAPVFDDRSNA